MKRNIIVAFAAVLFVFLFIGAAVHHNPLTHESMTITEAPCCAISLSGMSVLTNGHTTIVFFAATIFVLAVSIFTPSNVNIRLYHPPKR